MCHAQAGQGDYEVDEKQRTVALTEAGNEKHRAIAARGRSAQGRRSLRHRERHGRPPRQPGAARPQAVHARQGLHRPKDDEVVIIDEFTGRMMPGRRYSEGLHQALEAKEHVTDPAREPDARLDHLPELFPPLRQARRHDGHGDDRGRRILDIYKLDVIEIPTNVPVAALDDDDEVYRTAAEKYEAIIARSKAAPASASSRFSSARPRSRSPSDRR
jgi:preprotein translocase subunit SecA